MVFFMFVVAVVVGGLQYLEGFRLPTAGINWPAQLADRETASFAPGWLKCFQCGFSFSSAPRSLAVLKNTSLQV